MSTQDWFPGKDYPDREIWLKIRRTVRWVISEVQGYIYTTLSHDEDGKLTVRNRMPYVIGVNQAKRTAKRRDIARNGRPWGRAHQEIVRQRHAYYRRFA